MTRGQSAASFTPAGPLLQLLPLAGFLLWFVVGLPWGPHNEAYDWVVRLDTRSLASAAFERLPSVLSLRPLGIGLAWITYRLGGHDTAATQVLNAALALLAWWWLGRAVPARRAFALAALIVGGTGFAGYIWVFHVHGVFYGPLLLYVTWLVHVAREPIRASTLLRVAGVSALAALAHPFALPIAVAFGCAAVLRERALRSRAGLGALLVLLASAVLLYVVLVPANRRGLSGGALSGWITSVATTEVNRVVSLGMTVLATLTLSGLARGGRRWLVAAAGLLVAAFLVVRGLPVLPFWLSACALVSARRGDWPLLALLLACALLPFANPTGSPTYLVFAMFVAAAVVAQDAELDRFLAGPVEAVAALALAGALVLGLALRSGVQVPVASSVARPLLAERERSRQLPVLMDQLLRSPERRHPVRFARGSGNPVDLDATDRRYRPPTEDRHLTTWLAHRRGDSTAVGDTLFVAFGGDPLAAGATPLLTVRGRYAGDAIVFRRSSSVAADSVSGAR